MLLEVAVVADLVEDVLDGQALILWDGEVPDCITLDVALQAADEVLQKAAKESGKWWSTY